MTWQMYHRMADIHGYIDYLTSAYPDMCSQETIGYSVEGKPLKLLKISSGQPDSKAIWVDSGNIYALILNLFISTFEIIHLFTKVT